MKVSKQGNKNEHDDVDDDDDDVPVSTIQRIKLPPEEKRYNSNSNEHYRKGETGRGTRGGDEV